jgi:hypothetical protein
MVIVVLGSFSFESSSQGVAAIPRETQSKTRIKPDNVLDGVIGFGLSGLRVNLPQSPERVKLAKFPS